MGPLGHVLFPLLVKNCYKNNENIEHLSPSFIASSKKARKYTRSASSKGPIKRHKIVTYNHLDETPANHFELEDAQLRQTTKPICNLLGASLCYRFCSFISIRIFPRATLFMSLILREIDLVSSLTLGKHIMNISKNQQY
jgi:hypothetical protein